MPAGVVMRSKMRPELEGDRTRQPRAWLPEEPARGGGGYAERRSRAAMPPHPEREETITFADITEEEFRVLELIEAERQEQISGDGGNRTSR